MRSRVRNGAPSHLRVGDAHHAAPFGAEKRFHDNVAAQRRKGFQPPRRRAGRQWSRNVQASPTPIMPMRDTCPRIFRPHAVDSGRGRRGLRKRCSKSMRKTTCSSAIPAAWCGRQLRRNRREFWLGPPHRTPLVTRRKSTATASWPSRAAARVAGRGRASRRRAESRAILMESLSQSEVIRKKIYA